MQLFQPERTAHLAPSRTRETDSPYPAERQDPDTASVYGKAELCKDRTESSLVLGAYELRRGRRPMFHCMVQSVIGSAANEAS